ncbi:uncharacterized protein TRAVEDRAFT_152343 [Trametes versicolor FP-101664 SS1]|uniref:uncharacterized protein n=1 Tax=Trametes versicolor (strain FP-101664) TaxID=717944 RepID=UPI0004622D1D|nr:uncharacterized protein TRAVEDRAFT_152343 [Trametes versicolor FP-101664 SS1]EIW55792.1 hypothetical protein TRAVEDRAFT_152343 [Trametes versicolor FP-101664 SS1]
MSSQPSGSKRKNDDGAPAPAAKKTRGGAAHAATVALVNSILANPKGYPISGNEEVVRKSLVELAKYARSLEEQVADAGAPVAGSSKAAAAAKPAKSPAELEAAADKIRRAAQSGIKKQMTWKPSCKTGSAKFSYDGICPDPEVFGALMGLGGPPKFKMKKFSTDEFQKLVGPVEGSVRYDTLHITSSEVTVRWSDSGEFKFSGSYGKWQPGKDY